MISYIVKILKASRGTFCNIRTADHEKPDTLKGKTLN